MRLLFGGFFYGLFDLSDFLLDFNRVDKECSIFLNLPNLLGLLPNESHRLPMVPSTPELRMKLDGVLKRAGLLP